MWIIPFRLVLIEVLVYCSVVIIVFGEIELYGCVVALRVGAARQCMILVNGGGPLPSSERWSLHAVLWQRRVVRQVGAPMCVPWLVRDASFFP